MVKLRIRGVSFSYGSVDALKEVSFEVEGGEVLSVVGPNGSGKTTLLKCIDGILRPRVGSVLVDDVDLRELEGEERAKLLGLVPQLEGSRFPITVFEAVLLGRRPYIWWKPRERDVRKVYEVLTTLRIEHLATRSIDELSGGELRKVTIARALAQEPRVLLLDEPTNHLDLRHQLEVLDLLRNLADEEGICVIMATHDLNSALRYSDKVILLNEGRIHALGGVEVLSEENVRRVYGVEVEILRDSEGRAVIVPIRRQEMEFKDRPAHDHRAPLSTRRSTTQLLRGSLRRTFQRRPP